MLSLAARLMLCNLILIQPQYTQNELD